MGKLKEYAGKLDRVKMNRGWQWLLYIDIVLPVVLLVLALLPIPGFRQSMAKLYHTYTLFVLCPVPDFAALTGILGMLAHAGVLIWAVVRRDWKDLLICAAFTGAAAAFFLVQIDGTALNYLVVRLLDFGL